MNLPVIEDRHLLQIVRAPQIRRPLHHQPIAFPRSLPRAAYHLRVTPHRHQLRLPIQRVHHVLVHRAFVYRLKVVAQHQRQPPNPPAPPQPSQRLPVLHAHPQCRHPHVRTDPPILQQVRQQVPKHKVPLQNAVRRLPFPRQPPHHHQRVLRFDECPGPLPQPLLHLLPRIPEPILPNRPNRCRRLPGLLPWSCPSRRSHLRAHPMLCHHCRQFRVNLVFFCHAQSYQSRAVLSRPKVSTSHRTRVSQALAKPSLPNSSPFSASPRSAPLAPKVPETAVSAHLSRTYVIGRESPLPMRKAGSATRGQFCK